MSFAASVLAGPAGSSCVLMIMFTAESFNWSSGRKGNLQETFGCVIYPSVNIWLLCSMGTGTTVIQSCVKWLCRSFSVYWLWWKRDTRVHMLIFASSTVRCCSVRDTYRGSDRNITVFLQSSSMEPWQFRSFAKPGRTSGSGTTMATRQDYRQTRNKRSLIRGRSWMHFIHTDAGFIVPVDCLHAQIFGPQVHCVHRRSQSSLVRCILLEPAWRCSSSGQQSSELHSVHNNSQN